jgi:hypothetical protein
VSDVEYPHFFALHLIIDFVRMLHDRQLADAGFFGLGCHQRKIGKLAIRQSYARKLVTA